MEPKFNWSKIIQSLGQNLDGTQNVLAAIYWNQSVFKSHHCGNLDGIQNV